MELWATHKAFSPSPLLTVYASSLFVPSSPSSDFFFPSEFQMVWCSSHKYQSWYAVYLFIFLKKSCPLFFPPFPFLVAVSYLFVLLHGGIEFLREIIRHIGHAWLLLIAPTQAALVFAGFLIILLFSIFAVSLCHLQVDTRGQNNVHYLLTVRDLSNTNGKDSIFWN